MAFLLLGFRTNAAAVPTFLIASTNNNTQTQITVLNADPNANVVLYYPVNNSYTTLSLGTTNSTGYFTTTITPSTYNVTAGATSYVSVDGAQSQSQTWPTYSAASSNTSGTLSLSQNTVNVTAGQSITVTAYSTVPNIGTLSAPTNTTPSVASVSLSGSLITVAGLNTGSTNITICASSVGCNNMYVIVQQAGTPISQTQTQSSSALSFSQTSATLSVGQSQIITLSGPGGYYVSSNSNPASVSVSLSGSLLTLNGLGAGSTIIGVCSASGSMTSCGSVNATVSASPVTSTTNSQGTISFSNNNLTLSIGQTQSITATGSGVGGYNISANSDASVVSANYSNSGNNVINLTGLAPGGSNITICQIAGACGNVYVFIPQGAGTVAPVATTNNLGQPPVLSSFSIASNNVNNTFLGTGVALTFTFTTSQPVTSPTLTIGGSRPGIYGSGSGPYTAIYTMTGAEASLLPVVLTLPGATGNNSQISFSLSAGGVTSVITPAAVANCPVGLTCTAVSSSASGASSGTTFTSYLYSGMTPIGVVTPEVTALQNRLATDGIYTGPITGYFGSQTKTALEAYQTKHGLDPLGVVGPATRNLLNQGI